MWVRNQVMGVMGLGFFTAMHSSPLTGLPFFTSSVSPDASSIFLWNRNSGEKTHGGLEYHVSSRAGNEFQYLI